jgi:hypothetical protein
LIFIYLLLGDKRSFEAMIATVYRPENLKHVNKDHNIITSKTCVASTKDDSGSYYEVYV